MKQIWQVALYEYRRNVFKKSFILLLISVPAFIILAVGEGIFLESLENNSLPVGYVDHAGVFDDPITAPGIGAASTDQNDQSIEFISYASEEQAAAALKAGKIQVFNVFPPDYLESRQVIHYHIEKPGKNAERQFYNFLQINLLSSKPPEIAFRTAAGTDITVRSIDGRRAVPSGGPTFGLLMPVFITMAFLGMILMSSGYTLSAVAEEKENRTMEVLVTSISPNRLITGKILSIAGISLTLLIVWTTVILIGIGVGRQLGVGWLLDLRMDWRPILGTLAVAIPSYTLVIALMTAIGAMVTTSKEGQSVSSIFIILHLVPLYIGFAFLNNPHSLLAVILSLSPFTALMTIGMRNLFTIVPTWQILVSMGVQILFAMGAVWLAGRSLRLGLLRYGQRLTWRSLFNPQN
ncbi:MAG: ABC transporter permease [Chloroflexota bacterium]